MTKVKHNIDDPVWSITCDELLELRTCGTSEVPPGLGWSQYGDLGSKEVWMRDHDGKLWGRGVRDEG